MGYYKNGEPTKNFQDMEDEELVNAVVRVFQKAEKRQHSHVLVYMDEEEFQADWKSEDRTLDWIVGKDWGWLRWRRRWNGVSKR